MDTSYLDKLNPQQREAVVYKDGPSLVIAGAGSGKTRVLTYKIVDLLANGYEPNRIMALTFTNKAAREMKERVAAVVGDTIASRLWMGTFHSIFLRLLRRHADLIGFKQNFTIYDTSDSRSLVKMIVKDMGLDEKEYKPAAIAAAISNAKNALESPETYEADPENFKRDLKANSPFFGEIFRKYCQRCRLADAMDFDDILYFTNVLLRDRPDIKLHYQRWFRYILVDEYQDTNFAQHLIITQLAGEEQHLCVVGDDAQSIYSFRGADISNILTLQKRFPRLQIFKLERNYRSTQCIVNAAGSLIAKNRNQMPKNVYSENAQGRKIDIIRSFSDFEEAYLVTSLVQKSQFACHDSLEDYAILYRTNSQSRLLEEAFRKRNIPYRIYGGLAFYQRKEVKDVISYFRLAVNPDDDEALRRVINYPARGIGETTLGKVIARAVEDGVSLWRVLSEPASHPIKINKGTEKKLNQFVELIKSFQKEVSDGVSAYEVGQSVFNRTGILSLFAYDTTPETVSRQENLKEVLSDLKDFVDSAMERGDEAIGMADYLATVSLATDQDEADATDGAKITMMTVHAAKGLEFKHIYIVGMEQDLFPSAMAKTSKEIEEERRLFYVAITRAMETCTVTYAASRFRNGQTVASEPSLFLTDIDPQWVNTSASGNFATAAKKENFFSPVQRYLENERFRPRQNSAPATSTPYGQREEPSRTISLTDLKLGKTQMPAAQHTLDELEVGTKILHNKFGMGTITAIDTDSMEVIEVDFENVGLKKLMLRYAKFDIIS